MMAGFKEFLVGLGATSSCIQSSTDAKHLNPGTLQQLFDLYMAGNGPSQGLSSHRTFYRVYLEKWSRTLRFMPEHQHTPCNLCTRLRHFKRLARHPEQRKMVTRAIEQHVGRVLGDRSTMQRLMGTSEHYARMGVGKPAGFIQIDAMDHAKFAIPRWTDASKEWSDHWRPHLQCIGGIFWGMCEYWFLFGCDLAKNTNM